jgi:hypothetical protein
LTALGVVLVLVALLVTLWRRVTPRGPLTMSPEWTAAQRAREEVD